MLENNPVLRERLLGVAAISTILIGGAIGVDTMITSGWQPGGRDASAAPVIYASETPQQYFDDVERNWNAAPQRQVQFASLTPNSNASPAEGENLEGNSQPVTPTPAGSPLVVDRATPAAAPPQPAAPDTQTEADQHFAAIERDVQQATNANTPDTTPEKTPAAEPENVWPPS